MIRQTLTVLAIAGGFAALPAILPGAAPTGAAGAETTRGGTVTLGMLTCDLVRDANLVVFSREDYACTYRSARGASDRYDGQVSKIGADLEFKSGQTLKWAVLAPSAISGPGILAGNYVGGSAEATVVGGVGARVLLGGSRNQITLQPLSVSGQTGFGAAATLDALSLSPVRG
ncbi:MAG: DUF992 domain-containing protein [Alphaproteobacteria bacterium HGW-Alphaproteobacteria-6]|nr:MAG: DUF992 domain-containing protein [Alphaproteobacteria bacterium HGW-Alphaproteobacteria-6]